MSAALETIEGHWNRFWFRPEPPMNLAAARVLVGANAAWIVLSRPRLPDLFRWPVGFWSHVNRALLFRFLILPVGWIVEWILFSVLVAALGAAILGLWPRVTCFLSAILLYHFAPLEDIFSSDGGPFFRGLGVAVLAMLILSFAEQPRSVKESPSSEYRWPLTLIRFLFAFTYLFSGLAKLFVPGIRGWISKTHFQLIVAGLSTPDASPPWGHFFIDYPALATSAAAGILVLDLLFVAAVFSPRAAWVLVPAAAIMHVLAPRIVGVVFFNAPLLLLFVNWDSVARRLNALRTQPRDQAAKA